MTSFSSRVFLGCMLIVGQLAVGEFTTRCYNVNNSQYCWSTDGTQEMWQNASNACRARDSTLVSVRSSEIESVLRDFRTNVTAMYPNYDTNGMWLNVTTAEVDSFHWIEGTTGKVDVGGQQLGETRRFAAIMLDLNDNKTPIYRAYPWNDTSHYICQFTGSGVNCTFGFRNTSKCYLKYNHELVTWFTASKRCLSMSGTLATFNDLSTLNGDSNLTSWLSLSPAVKYWVGLVRRWFIIEQPDGSMVDVQYTNWESGSPQKGPDNINRCILLMNNLQWSDSVNCTHSQRFACQTITPIRTTSTTTSTTTTTRTATTTTTTKATTSSSSSSSSSVQRLISVVSSYSIAQTSTEQRMTSQPSLSSTTSANNVKSADLEATTSVIPLAVGIGVGVGVPVVIAIIVVLVIIFYRRRQKNRDEDGNAKITAVNKRVSRNWSKQKQINAYETSPYGEFENSSSPPPTEPPAEEHSIYAAVIKSRSNETDDAERSVKTEVRDGVIYAELQPVT